MCVCPSTRCSLHTLEADGVLLGGLLDGAAGGGDQWKHGHEAQREEQRESDKTAVYLPRQSRRDKCGKTRRLLTTSGRAGLIVGPRQEQTVVLTLPISEGVVGGLLSRLRLTNTDVCSRVR